MSKRRSHPLIDEGKQRIARHYRRDNRYLTIISYVLSAGVIFVLIFFHFSKNIAAWLAQISGMRFFIIFGYFIIIYIIYNFLQFPLSFMRGFVIEHKYGFSTQNFTGWFFDWIKSLFVGCILGIIVVEFIYFVTIVSTHWWWLLLSLGMILINVILVNLFPVLILPLFYRTTPITQEDIVKRIKELCVLAKLDIKSVDAINLSSKSTKANAAVVGLGNTKKILLGDTLLNDYTEDEILSVLAHEIAHYKGHHVWYLILWQSIITAVLFFLFYLIHPWLYRIAGFTSVADIASFPLFILIFSLFSLMIKPVGSAISRYYERQADQGALDFVNEPEAFINVMAKFCNKHLAIAYPHPLIEWYSYSHPSPGKRIDFIEAWWKLRNL